MPQPRDFPCNSGHGAPVLSRIDPLRNRRDTYFKDKFFIGLPIVACIRMVIKVNISK